MKVLETRGLTKIYGGAAAVDNVSLTIEKGDIYGLIGQNGAGKTTFMRMVTSLAHPDSGEIELFGKADDAGLQAARKRMGSVIEHPALYPNLTAKQNLEYYRIQRGIPNKGAVQQSLEFVGLTNTGKKKFKDFSMGMKQRLALALTLMSKPDFIILDEPINGLDPIGIVEIRELIKSLSNSGVTILLSSHILTELSQIATKYAFIHDGRLVKNLTHAQLQEECKRALSLSVDDVAKTAALLETNLGITDYKQVSATELRVYELLDKVPEITHLLTSEGIRVSAAHEVGDSLEDYYQKIIGGAQ
ncbi:MAG: ATP-binding cassette domain-containing protein [Coriobacteriia bacterium]|nr:ATP-binding cassette domain-containing protein [Coriobacteriia bacterium]MCL2745489.1 ATP-binding cassette domain-containing protein [Coriobacteriia bacterium]MCL2871198.1 ATP-binding cassette domain-containing protein [Coriobacteriia bacterium]